MNIKGVLSPLFSLPNRFGIGDLGLESFKFINIIREHGFNTWQLLPLNPITYGNSPYQSYSSYAIEELYLSLDSLTDEGLLERVPSFNKDASNVDYEAVRKYKVTFYKKAFDNYISKFGYDELNKFRNENYLINEYAMFMALKEINNGDSWNKWKVFDSIDKYKIEYYHLFMQMKLYSQLNKLRQYAHILGVSLMGDIPFYVSYDSSDVYYHRDQFLLDENNEMKFVSGVGPDFFSKTGQLWGNPIYDFAKMQKSFYEFWVNRMRHMNGLFDYIRIDHFRAFDTYYAIPSNVNDATKGEWWLCPGYEIFDTLNYAVPNMQIVAEDLGMLRPEVLTLRDHYHYPGMNVLQFTIFDIIKNNKKIDNLVTYLGTHDNMTTRSFLSTLKPKQLILLRKFFNKENIKFSLLLDCFIAYAIRQPNFVISLVDILHLDDKSRINTPSVVSNSNWSMRMINYDKLEKSLTKKIYEI